MELKKTNAIVSSYWKELLLFLALLLFVLIANYPAISYGLVYYEQPLLYLANQKINSFSDLLSIYLNPQMLYAGSITFFRPSGHFLLYQLLTPFLGWHNIKGLIFVNLFFLALCGYLFIKIYALLFPRFKIGGMVAFALYLMHPALILSRMMVMHFEFAYVFFCLLSLYCFILFCQKNITFNQTLIKSNLFFCSQLNTYQFQYFNLFAWSLIFFAIAVTFKEISISLSLALLSYFFISFYDKKPLLKFIPFFISNKEIRKILIVIISFTLILACYINSQWSAVHFPHSDSELTFNNGFVLMVTYIQYIFGLSKNPVTPQWTHLNIYSPFAIRVALWTFSALLLASSLLIYATRSENNLISYYKKSLFFLYTLALIFLILPICYKGWPWHINMAIVAIALAMGFSFEYLFHWLSKNKTSLLVTGSVITLLLGLTNIIFINAQINTPHNQTNFILKVNHNAVFNPPNIKNKLTSESILVVEDTRPIGEYALGNGFYPINDLNTFKQYTKGYFLKPDIIYNGTLFRWAYLMPNLKEEIYAFHADHMQNIPDDILYTWLQNYNNIYSVGYDDQATWHDLTPIFKKNLLLEKSRRHLIANHYFSFQEKAIVGQKITATTFSSPNYYLCEKQCDQNKQCSGFNFLPIDNATGLHSTCVFLSAKKHAINTVPCTHCTGFIKQGKA